MADLSCTIKPVINPKEQDRNNEVLSRDRLVELLSGIAFGGMSRFLKDSPEYLEYLTEQLPEIIRESPTDLVAYQTALRSIYTHGLKSPQAEAILETVHRLHLGYITQRPNQDILKLLARNLIDTLQITSLFNLHTKPILISPWLFQGDHALLKGSDSPVYVVPFGIKIKDMSALLAYYDSSQHLNNLELHFKHFFSAHKDVLHPNTPFTSDSGRTVSIREFIHYFSNPENRTVLWAVCPGDPHVPLGHMSSSFSEDMTSTTVGMGVWPPNMGLGKLLSEVGIVISAGIPTLQNLTASVMSHNAPSLANVQKFANKSHVPEDSSSVEFTINLEKIKKQITDYLI